MARDALRNLPNNVSLLRLPMAAAFPLIALTVGVARAQEYRFAPRVQPELRLEAVMSDAPAALAGIGFNVPAGYFVRLGPSVAAGRVLGDSAATTVRADMIARFLTDPFHESNWGVYGGGGVSVTWTDGRRAQQALALVAGAEFPGRNGWRPAIELGLGGGARVALVFRPVRRTGR